MPIRTMKRRPASLMSSGLLLPICLSAALNLLSPIAGHAEESRPAAVPIAAAAADSQIATILTDLLRLARSIELFDQDPDQLSKGLGELRAELGDQKALFASIVTLLADNGLQVLAEENELQDALNDAAASIQTWTDTTAKLERGEISRDAAREVYQTLFDYFGPLSRRIGPLGPGVFPVLGELMGYHYRTGLILERARDERLWAMEYYVNVFRIFIDPNIEGSIGQVPEVAKADIMKIDRDLGDADVYLATNRTFKLVSGERFHIGCDFEYIGVHWHRRDLIGQVDGDRTQGYSYSQNWSQPYDTHNTCRRMREPREPRDKFTLQLAPFAAVASVLAAAPAAGPGWGDPAGQVSHLNRLREARVTAVTRAEVTGAALRAATIFYDRAVGWRETLLRQ